MDDLQLRASRIQLAVFDVDGIFTDGRLYYDADGENLKVFHVQDGLGIRRLLDHGVEVAVISGRDSAAVSRRMHELGIRHVHQGCDDKLPVMQALQAELGITAEQTACMGDDLPDLPLLRQCGLAVSVPDAPASVHATVHYVTSVLGGSGAVREFCELLLQARSIAI